MDEDDANYILDRVMYFLFGVFVGIVWLFLRLIQAFVEFMETYNIPIDINI